MTVILQDLLSLDGNNWSFTIPAEFLGEGTHTIVAEASTGGSEPFTSESAPITITAECPPPPDGGGGGGGAGGGGGGGGGGAGGGAGGAVEPVAELVAEQQVAQLQTCRDPSSEYLTQKLNVSNLS